MSHNNDTIYRQAAIDAHCELCGDRYKCNSDICPDVEVFQLIPAVQSEPQWIPEVMAIPADDDRVSLSETVTATYYNEENEEWSRKSVTIRDVLDSVCDEYTVLPYAQPQYEELTPEEAVSEIVSGSIKSAWYWVDTVIRLKQMGFAICRKR